MRAQQACIAIDARSACSSVSKVELSLRELQHPHSCRLGSSRHGTLGTLAQETHIHGTHSFNRRLPTLRLNRSLAPQTSCLPRVSCVGKCRRLLYNQRPIPQQLPSHPSAHRLCLLRRPAALVVIIIINNNNNHNNTNTNPPRRLPATRIMLRTRPSLLPRQLQNARRGNTVTVQPPVTRETSRLKATRS